MAALQHQHAQRRRQRQRDESRDDDRDRDRHGELAVELAGESAEEGDRHEHGAKRQHDRDDRARHLVHRLDRGLARRELPFAHVPLDVLQHDDRVVDDDADREHHAEERQRVDRVAERVEAGERPDQRYRDRHERDDRRAPALEKEIDDEEDEQHRLGQRLHDLGDRHFDEARRVVRNGVGQAFGKLLRERARALPDRLRDAERIGAGGEEDADEGGLVPVVAADEIVVLRAQLDARDVGQAYRRAVGIRADDDLAELLRVGEPALGRDRVDEVLLAADRRLADLAGGELRVLLVDRGGDVAGRQLQLREAVGQEPDPHRVVLGAEDLDVRRARAAASARPARSASRSST